MEDLERLTVFSEPGPHHPTGDLSLFAMQSVSENRCRVSYDPIVHGALWQNDKPFTLQLYDKRLKKCRGCGTSFRDVKFVVLHEELRDFWRKGMGRITASTASF